MRHSICRFSAAVSEAFACRLEHAQRMPHSNEKRDQTVGLSVHGVFSLEISRQKSNNDPMVLMKAIFPAVQYKIKMKRPWEIGMNEEHT